MSGDHRDLHYPLRRQRQMCIRDSFSSNRAGIHLSGRVKIGHLQPVSYTHLRAHETPEHLVCRLLLEKKKSDHPLTSFTLSETTTQTSFREKRRSYPHSY